jgi:hypothetical protein
MSDVGHTHHKMPLPEADPLPLADCLQVQKWCSELEAQREDMLADKQAAVHQVGLSLHRAHKPVFI